MNSTERSRQKKNTRRANSAPKSKKPNRKQLNAAKLRWKLLAQRILNAPGNTSANGKLQSPTAGGGEYRQDPFNTKEQIICVENRQSYETQPLPKRRKTSVGYGRSAARRRPAVPRQQQKIGRQRHRLLSWMKTWLTQANFSQSTKDQNSNETGEAFIITEDDRNGFSQTMVKSCQQNPNMRTLFLESVRMLALSGLMHAAAPTLLKEESCDQAQTLMDAWEDFKEQNTTTRALPMNLLNAVNQLHEKRGDLASKLSTSKDSCELRQLDEKTWTLKLPAVPMEDKSLSQPIVTENLGQDHIPG